MSKISLKNNTIANYLGQFYFIAIGLVVTPIYLKYLGPEAYGLIGFFILLQTWLNLLDIGLTPTLGRQISYFRAKNNNFIELRKLLKSLELIFLFLSILTIVFVFFIKDWISSDWVNIELLKKDTVEYCVILMGIMIGLRWFIGLYQSGINGFEDQIWLNFTKIIIATLKFVGALLLLAFVTTDITHFFEYQFMITLLELFLLMRRFYFKLPLSCSKVPIVSFHFASVKKIAPFALGVAYTASIWILVAQVDKLVLSGALSLVEFGYFSLIIIVAGAINSMSGAISQAVQPRMTYLLSSNNEDEMISLYKSATQLVTLISMSVAFVIGLNTEAVIFAWTGNLEATKWSSNILIWYALGNGFLAIFAFQYYLQVAHGKLKLHAKGATLSLIIDVPIMVYAAINFGAMGSGVAWLTLRIAWLLFWTPIVHNKFAPGLHMRWLTYDIGLIIFVIFLWTYFIHYSFDILIEENRVIILVKLISIGLSTLIVGSIASSFVRNKIINVIKEMYVKN